MGTAITLAAVLIVLGCVAFAAVYHRSGSEWWVSHLGRALMILDTCLFAVLAYVTERRLATGSPDPGHGADVAELGIFLSVGAAEWYLVYAFHATLATWRRRRMMTISRGANTMSEVNPDSTQTTPEQPVAAQASAEEEANHQPAADAAAEPTETATHELATPAAVQAHETLAQHARDFLATVQQDVQGAANGIAAHLRDWLNAVGL